MIHTKYCNNPNLYQEYWYSFQIEYLSMKQLEKQMANCGKSDLYHKLFPHYESYGCTDDGQPYICMDYIKGCTLEEKLCTKNNSCKGPKQLLSKAQICHLYEQLNTAIYWLHQVGILYLDLSPQNILILNNDYDIKLIDFTDCYHFNKYSRRYRQIDVRLDSALPPCIQLKNAGALLFTRLFFSGNKHYCDYFSFGQTEDAIKNRQFFTKEYGKLLNCLFFPNSEPAYSKNEFLDEFSLVQWEEWYHLLLKFLK